MITIDRAEAFKDLASFLAEIIPGGVVFGITNRETITWRIASKAFDIPFCQVGDKIRVGGGPYRAMQDRIPITEKVDREVYGVRLLMISTPFVDENDVVIGSITAILPRLHPVASAFPDFAPIMADMFPEGSFMYLTSLNDFAARHGSKKFDVPDVQVGVKLKDGAAAYEAMHTKQLSIREFDASMYGVPVQVMNYPLFDEDDAEQVVGTMGITLPRQHALELRQMATNLTSGLEEISAVIEQMAASAAQINSNEKLLNQNVNEVFKLSEDINEVLAFIKQIADETKMLGLNAAIEAARAGDAGRGFGVVAEEIRKLSDESKETVGKIRALTERIKDKITETTKNSQVTLHSSEEQAAGTQEITASIEEITGMAENLNRIALEM
ncbi:MAG: methyl-accepting chemotaxis protein [Syntrophomonadaceae bacterium]|nr:methyl-accepting chemotaxis protein [Syntrophomonadaceae bacterium]